LEIAASAGHPILDRSQKPACRRRLCRRVVGISGFNPPIIDPQWVRETSAHSQGVTRSETAPEIIGMMPAPPRPEWVAQLIGDSSEAAALSRFRQKQGKLQPALGGFSPPSSERQSKQLKHPSGFAFSHRI
jgi:hypothetical protein